MSSLARIPLPELAISAHGIVLVGLAAFVSYQRTVNNVIDGNKGERTAVGKAVRAHGNAAEYIPYLTVTYLYYALQPAKRTTFTDALIIVSTVGRILHAAGILLSGSKPENIHFGRPIGAASTYASMFALAATIGVDALQKIL